MRVASRTGSADPSTRSRSDSRRRRSRAAASTRDSDTPSATSSDASRREPEPSSCSRRAASSPAGAGETTRRPGATFTRATESAPAKKLTPSVSSASPRRASPPNASAPCSRSRARRSRGSTPFGPSSLRATRSSRAGRGQLLRRTHPVEGRAGRRRARHVTPEVVQLLAGQDDVARGLVAQGAPPCRGASARLGLSQAEILAGDEVLLRVEDAVHL